MRKLCFHASFLLFNSLLKLFSTALDPNEQDTALLSVYYIVLDCAAAAACPSHGDVSRRDVSEDGVVVTMMLLYKGNQQASYSPL